MVSSMLVLQTKQTLCLFLEGEHAFFSPHKKISLLMLTTETKQTLAYEPKGWAGGQYEPKGWAAGGQYEPKEDPGLKAGRQGDGAGYPGTCMCTGRAGQVSELLLCSHSI